MTPESLSSSALALFLATVTLGYSLTVWIWPFKACRYCRGQGKIRSPLIRAIRLCPICRATGLRPRIGLRLFNQFRRLHRANRKNR